MDMSPETQEQFQAIQEQLNSLKITAEQINDHIANIYKFMDKENEKRENKNKSWMVELNEKGEIVFQDYKNSIIIYGDTTPHKDFLRSLGAKWNRTLKSWIFVGAKKDERTENLKTTLRTYLDSKYGQGRYDEECNDTHTKYVLPIKSPYNSDGESVNSREM